MEKIIVVMIVLAAAGYVGYVLTGVFRAKKPGDGCRCTSAVCPYAGQDDPPCEKCEAGELMEIGPEKK